MTHIRTSGKVAGRGGASRAFIGSRLRSSLLPRFTARGTERSRLTANHSPVVSSASIALFCPRTDAPQRVTPLIGVLTAEIPIGRLLVTVVGSPFSFSSLKNACTRARALAANEKVIVG